jgi:hypothetical protein
VSLTRMARRIGGAALDFAANAAIYAHVEALRAT